jgi:hypothetical protein
MSNGIFVGSGGTSFTQPGLGSGSSFGIDYEDYPTYDINYGQKKEKSRYSKFSDALASASAYRDRAKDKAIIDASVGKNKDDDKGTKGFKISPDTTVVEGYMDPGYTIPGQKGRSLLGTVGAFVSPFAPITGQAIGAVGNLTGI